MGPPGASGGDAASASATPMRGDTAPPLPTDPPSDPIATADAMIATGDDALLWTLFLLQSPLLFCLPIESSEQIPELQRLFRALAPQALQQEPPEVYIPLTHFCVWICSIILRGFLWSWRMSDSSPVFFFFSLTWRRYRRSRSRSASRSPVGYRGGRAKGGGGYSRSPVRSVSPAAQRPRGGAKDAARPERSRRRVSRSRSRSPSGSRSRSPPASSPKRPAKSRSPSSSRGGAAGQGLVSYGDGSPDSTRWVEREREGRVLSSAWLGQYCWILPPPLSSAAKTFSQTVRPFDYRLWLQRAAPSSLSSGSSWADGKAHYHWWALQSVRLSSKAHPSNPHVVSPYSRWAEAAALIPVTCQRAAG